MRSWCARRSLVPAALAVLAACSGCGRGYHPRTLPPAASPPPGGTSVGGSLRAGFGRADITPPPGVGMFGYGPESREARGYRFRLYARALVMEDKTGERIALVVADLGAISPLLHRLTAERAAAATGIGADRLLLSATHTHSGPSHFLDAKQLNDYGSSVAGFDTVMVEFLVARIAGAVSEAASELRPARAAWGSEPVWGYTRNRSYEAFVLNDATVQLPAPSAADEFSERELSVDPSWTMLRVDLLDPERGTYEPAGALSIFAIHGTGIPAPNDLFDADVMALIERGLELHIDSLNNRRATFRPQAVHLLANGSDGDVSPDWPEETRCPTPKLERPLRPGGPRTPPAPEKWVQPPDAEIAACLSAARAYVNETGAALSARAIAMFDRLGKRLGSDLQVSRSFRALPLKGDSAPPALCSEPRVGTATVGGADDGRTRYYDWQFLGLTPSGYKQSTASDYSSTGDCQSPKRYLLGHLQGLVVGPHGFPEVAQLMVIRIGHTLLGAVPAEVTTGAGVRMKAAMRVAAEAAGVEVEIIALIGLANGYIQYVTTREEYAAQRYEAASVLYGPQTASVIAEQLGQLTTELTATPPQTSLPSSQQDALIVYPGGHKSIFPSANAGPTPGQIDRTIAAALCRGDTVVIHWNDAYPGRLVPADGPIVVIERETESGWEIALWDDDANLEVRAIGPEGQAGYLWEARWTPRARAGRFRAVLLARSGFSEILGTPFERCS